MPSADLSSPAVLLALLVIVVPPCVLPVLLIRRSRRLRARRSEAVRQAAAEARERLARDVHDLLGGRLWLASLRSELAYRLVEEDSPARAALAEAMESIRQAAAEVRNVTRSYQEISVWSEIADARAVLAACGTSCEVEATEVKLAPEVDAVLAVTVREAVTNMLRHSHASLCVIRITPVETDGARVDASGGATGTGSRAVAPGVRLSIANDGVRSRVAAGAGSGIRNLRRRAAELGGVVGTSADPDGWFRLIAEFPHPLPRDLANSRRVGL
ncbi:sensor histidine kinase [Sphaerimonospora sp. CA-214678]|uniref:sensor histidine kinase n=1 Tax=Sphaerimonospora sp. CA-214678 TaxID=3240029 RepID=UPI003D928E52